MKRAIKLGLALVAMMLSVVIVITSCAPKAAPTPEAPKTPAAPAPKAAPGKVWKLKVATSTATANYAWGPRMVLFKDVVEKRSDGRIIIEYYPSDTLVAHRGIPDAVRAGIAQIGYPLYPYWPDVWPLEQLGSHLPLWRSHTQSGLIFNITFDEFLKAEMDASGFHELFGTGNAKSVMFSKSKPVYRIEDFKGMTIKGGTRPIVDHLQAMGVVTVDIIASEIYEALQKGQIEGASSPIPSHWSSRYYETGKPGYIIDIGGFPSCRCGAILEKGYWESLPKDIQQILDEEAFNIMALGWNEISDAVDVDIYKPKLIAGGMTWIEWSPAEMKRSDELKLVLLDKWAAEMDAKGLRGSDYLAKVKELVKLPIEDLVKMMKEIKPFWKGLGAVDRYGIDITKFK